MSEKVRLAARKHLLLFLALCLFLFLYKMIGQVYNLTSNQEDVILVLSLASSFLFSFLVWFMLRSILHIEKREQKLKAWFSSMDNLTFIIDKNFRYIDIAPSKEDLLIAPAKKLINRSIYDFLPDEACAGIETAIRIALKSGSTQQLEYQLQISGEQKWFSARVCKLDDEKVIMQVYDATEKYRNHQALIDSEKKYRELNATKNKMFSIVAHDIRNPINTIYGYSSLLHSDYDDFNDEERREFIRLLFVSTSNAVGLIDNLLSWAKAQQGEITLHSKTLLLIDVMADVLAEVTDQARMKGVVISMNIPEDLYVKADPNMLMITMRNLLCNAVKFSNSGSHVLIKAKDNLNTGKIVLEVYDEGIGMDEKQVADILKGIRNTSRYGTENEKGSGLGLVLCRDLIKMHGSELQIESRPGHGSVFRFSLPGTGIVSPIQKITLKQPSVN